MFVRGPDNANKFMDESSAGGSVLQRANDEDEESYMGHANDQEYQDDNTTFFDGDKGMQKVATDGNLQTINAFKSKGL